MVSSISSTVPFSSARSLDKLTPQMMRTPGLYANTGPVVAMPEENTRKRGGLFSATGRLILWAAIISGASVAAKKWIPQVHNAKALDKLAPDAKFMEKAYSRIAKFADSVEVNFAKGVDAVKGYMKKNKQAEV